MNTREGKEDNRNKGQNSKQKTVTNMVGINPTMLIITLNHNGLNVSIKEQRFLRVYQKKQEPTLCCL